MIDFLSYRIDFSFGTDFHLGFENLLDLVLEIFECSSRVDMVVCFCDFESPDLEYYIDPEVYAVAGSFDDLDPENGLVEDFQVY